jgi:hypothetical protein
MWECLTSSIIYLSHDGLGVTNNFRIVMVGLN